MVIPLVVPIRSNSTYFSLLIVYALVVYSVLVSSLGLVVRVCSVVLFSFVCATSSFMCSSPRDSSIIRPFLVASTGYAVFFFWIVFGPTWPPWQPHPGLNLSGLGPAG